MQKRILIVEDEPAIRDMVAFALRKDDYEPVHAGLGLAAVAGVHRFVVVYLHRLPAGATVTPCRSAS